jgi:hypothetical protein
MQGDGFYESEEWAEEREMVLEDWDGECERCGCLPISPHVHHAKGLKQKEFEVLCPDCHAEHHKRPEIADYCREEPVCKFCGQAFRWGKDEQGNWIPMDPSGKYRHFCKGIPDKDLP